MPDPTAFGAAFQISTQNVNAQVQSSLAVLRDGRVAVVWRDSGTNSGDIKLQIIAADGTPRGAEATVNVTTTGQQSAPSVAALSGGGFVVGWESFATDASGDVAYRTFRANGTSTMAVDGQVNVTTGYQQDISVVGLTGGSFAIGWNEGNTAVTGLGSSTAAMARSLDGTGALGAALRISGNWGGDYGPRLAFDNTFFGTPYFLAAWDDSSGPSIDLNGNDGIYARLLEGPPLPTSNFADGGIRIDSGPFREASVDPDVAVAGAGAGAIVVWDDIYSVTVGRDILLSRNSSLSRAKTTMTGDQVQAAVAALPDGGFVVVWCDLAGTGGGDIRGRVHDAAGLPTSDTDFLVTKAGTASAGVQFNPDVSALIDGRFMVSWSDATTGLGIQGRIFDARTAPPIFAGKADGDRIYGTNFAASDIIDGVTW